MGFPNIKKKVTKVVKKAVNKVGKSVPGYGEMNLDARRQPKTNKAGDALRKRKRK